MYSEFDYFSFLGMSNSEFFLEKEEEKQIKFEVSSRPTLEFPDGCQVTPPNNEPELHDNKKEEKCEGTEASKELKTPSLGEFEVTDDDDGFRTPTSLDHKIPVITQCPQAPRKLKPQPSTKRKLSPKLRRNLQVLDLSEEVVSLFPPTLQDNMGRKIKKARRDDNE
uniref:Cyclin-dependent protein kinase inhibitor SMR3-like n=1 Tax=Davidia involucrata TaxID=16924 RepID=A0A5B6YW67_DAVIN